MIAKKAETAEQKLLKMLESSGGSGVAASPSEAKFNKKRSLLTVVKSINKILLLGVAVGCLFLVLEILSGMKLMNVAIDFSIDETAQKREVNPLESIPGIPSLNTYLAPLQVRNLFLPYEEPKAVNAEVITEKNRAIVDQTSNLKLVGISWLDTVDTASVMLEDKEKGVTYFLKAGEKIGDIIVKTIYADSAVLGYQNEEMIIKYDKPQQ